MCLVRFLSGRGKDHNDYFTEGEDHETLEQMAAHADELVADFEGKI